MGLDNEVPSHTFMQEDIDANNVSPTQEPIKASGFEEGNDVDLDELETPQGSEDECDKHKYHRFKMFDYGDAVRHELGVKFATK